MEERQEIIAERIRTIVDEKGIKQKWLAKKLGISTASLSRKLNGLREWTLCEALDLAKVLEIDLDYFF